MKPTVYNGKTTSFWKDEWMGIPLQNSFPLLYCLSNKKDIAIADLWDGNSQTWRLYFHRNLKETEIEEWAALSHILKPLDSINQDDQWSWKLEKDSLFSVNSLYKVLSPLMSLAIALS